MTKETAGWLSTTALFVIFLALAIALFANVPHGSAAMAEQVIPNANPQRADEVIHQYGCGSCHTIPGIAGAQGTVGPKLDGISTRSFLAGQIPNSPDNLMLWIQHPQRVRPGGDMPDLGVSDADARDIAAYLYSLH